MERKTGPHDLGGLDPGMLLCMVVGCQLPRPVVVLLQQQPTAAGIQTTGSCYRQGNRHYGPAVGILGT